MANNIVSSILSKMRDIKDIASVKTTADTDKIASVLRMRVSTGCDTIDASLGSGIPIGRVLELYGDPSDGKSSLLISILKECQKIGGISSLYLTEPDIDIDRMQRAGMDIDNLILTEPRSIEEGFDTLYEFLKMKLADKTLRDIPSIVGWDTLVSAPTRTELEGKKWGEGMMSKPRIIRQGLSRIGLLLAQTSTTLIAVSQTIASPDPYSPPGTSGGGGLKFWSVGRMYIHRSKYHDDPSGKPDGILSYLKLYKAKIPDCLVTRKVPIYIGHTRGVDNDWSSYYALEGKAYTYNRGWYFLRLPDRPEVKFRWSDFKNVLDSDPTLRPAIKDLTYKAVQGLPIDTEGVPVDVED